VPPSQSAGRVGAGPNPCGHPLKADPCLDWSLGPVEHRPFRRLSDGPNAGPRGARSAARATAGGGACAGQRGATERTRARGATRSSSGGPVWLFSAVSAARAAGRRAAAAARARPPSGGAAPLWGSAGSGHAARRAGGPARRYRPVDAGLVIRRRRGAPRWAPANAPSRIGRHAQTIKQSASSGAGPAKWRVADPVKSSVAGPVKTRGNGRPRLGPASPCRLRNRRRAAQGGAGPDLPRRWTTAPPPSQLPVSSANEKGSPTFD